MVAAPKRSLKVFISYSADDHEVARLIRQQLIFSGFEVVTPEDSLPGDNVLLMLGRALADADALVVLLSPASIKSSNMMSELSYALSSPRFADRVIPVLVEATKDIPWILNRFEIVRADRNVKQAAKSIVTRLSADSVAAQL